MLRRGGCWNSWPPGYPLYRYMYPRLYTSVARVKRSVLNGYTSGSGIQYFVTQIESCKWLPGQFLKSYRHGSEADEMHTSKNDSHWPCHSYLWTCLSQRDSHQHKGFRDSSIGIWKQYKRCQENMKRLKALEEVKKCRNVKSLFCHDAACEEALARHNPLPSAGALGEMYWDRANADDTNRIQLGFSQHSSFARKRARTRIDPIVSLQRCTCWAVAKSTLFRVFHNALR